jgi:3-hydroxybutyryl-CoA dehydrogenase
MTKKRAVVLGGGTMGLGIAYVLLQSDYSVELVEPDELRRNSLHASLLKINKSDLGSEVIKIELLNPEKFSTFSNLASIKKFPDIFIEAVSESLLLKREVLALAEEVHPKLLATNTSSISIDALSANLIRPSDFIGLHFFNPVWVNELVEIVYGKLTSTQTLDSAIAFVESIRKINIVVADSPGFATSRLGVSLGLEAIRMLEDGIADVFSIDKAMKIGYKHPIGPLKLTDLVGLDVRLAISENLFLEFGERFRPPELLKHMVSEGKLGKKSGQGFYEWDPTR